MHWNGDPQDAPEPGEELVQVCNDCWEDSDMCECENSSGITPTFWAKCLDCGRTFPTDEAWANHDCDGPTDEWWTDTYDAGELS